MTLVYTDHTIIRFGKYKGKRLIDVPDDWLHWYWRQNRDIFLKDAWRLSVGTQALMTYIQDSMNVK